LPSLPFSLRRIFASSSRSVRSTLLAWPNSERVSRIFFKFLVAFGFHIRRKFLASDLLSESRLPSRRLQIAQLSGRSVLLIARRVSRNSPLIISIKPESSLSPWLCTKFPSTKDPEALKGFVLRARYFQVSREKKMLVLTFAFQLRENR